ncbi:MAG: hypothetical protein Q4D34_03500 [Eggerthellaceae bacterium]|nr:hypothetical protein [Eggerthellaceae bacterium]
MFKNVKPIRVLQVLGLAMVLSLSVALVGCGSSSSSSPDPIVGKWNLNSIQTDESTGIVQNTNGNATIDKNGSASIQLGSDITLTGSWATIPKEQWPESTSTELVGAYEMSLKMSGSDSASTWTAFIIKSSNEGKYAMGIFAVGTEISLYFDRAI